MITLAQFVAQWSGRFCDFDHAFGNQCVDIAQQWTKDGLGLPPLQGNAINILRPTPGFTEILNGPTNAPAPGDLVIWGQNSSVGTGPYGHIAICVTATPTAFTAFSQNWPEHSPCHNVDFSFVGVLGWLHPGMEPPPPPAPTLAQHTPAQFEAAAKIAAIDKMSSNVPVADAPAHWLSIVQYVKDHA